MYLIYFSFTSIILLTCSYLLLCTMQISIVLISLAVYSFFIFIMTITTRFITIKTFLIWSLISITIDFTILKDNFYLSSYNLIHINIFISSLVVPSFTFIFFTFSSIDISTLEQRFDNLIIILKYIFINCNILTYYFA